MVGDLKPIHEFDDSSAPVRPTLPSPAKIRLSIRDRALRLVPGMGLKPELQKAVIDAINANADSSTSLGAALDQFDRDGAPTDRLLTLVDWVGTLLDVNGDGLPDLVLAKGATCWSGVNLPTLQTDHQPGGARPVTKDSAEQIAAQLAGSVGRWLWRE